ncbi:MAG: carboxypeptidase regulatory-like domain-containing protein [Euryarchaeota archaeon]|nr:carboxypeptidase regulatory-like domain-containing protein [Euryarchaeota archaeon]
MNRLVALAAVLVLAFSGCVDSGDGTTASSQPPAPTEATVDASTGGIEGVVTDDELVPIADANVGIAGKDLVGKTSAGGRFAFSQLDPADYNVMVERIGYFSKTVKASVKAGEVTRLDIVLERIPVSEEGFDDVAKFSDQLPASDACAAREAYDLEAIDAWPEPTRGVTWQKYPVTVNATKPDGTDLLAIRMRIELKHQPSDATVDIDIRLVDAADVVLGNGWTDGADESIDYQKVLKPGTYDVYVCYWAGAQADYKITVTTSYEQGERATYLRAHPKEIEYPDDA